MTKREFRRLWAVPADIDARVRRMHRLEESLLKEPLVVTDTVQASGLSAPYALGTVTVRGVCAADGPEARAKKRAEVRRMARALEQANARYERDYAAALCAIEAIEDAALRCAVQLSCLEGMRWEAVADELACCLVAPLPLILLCGLENSEEISGAFGISRLAADHIFLDYQRYLEMDEPPELGYGAHLFPYTPFALRAARKGRQTRKRKAVDIDIL